MMHTNKGMTKTKTASSREGKEITDREAKQRDVRMNIKGRKADQTYSNIRSTNINRKAQQKGRDATVNTPGRESLVQGDSNDKYP